MINLPLFQQYVMIVTFILFVNAFCRNCLSSNIEVRGQYTCHMVRYVQSTSEQTSKRLFLKVTKLAITMS